ncbi:MAG: hypothetical protein AAGG55_17090 [Pseudomonadota bacterium]
MTISPFGWLNERQLLRVFLALTVILLAMSTWMARMDRALVTDKAPNGIVSFELAGDARSAKDILDAWDSAAQSVAMLVQGVDYLYLVVYTLWFSMACWLISRRLGPAWQRMGVVTAWLVLLAAPFDAIENYGLIIQLLHGPNDGMAFLSRWMAIPKFGVLLIAVAYLLVALIPRLRVAITNRASA